MGLGVSDFVSIGHIFAFLSSHYTFSSQARILKCPSRRVLDLPFATRYNCIQVGYIDLE